MLNQVPTLKGLQPKFRDYGLSGLRFELTVKGLGFQGLGFGDWGLGSCEFRMSRYQGVGF